jgi:integrative and conjugative element protein (TIGR02256 family)
LKLINKQTLLELIVSKELVDRIVNCGAKKYPNEFGGLLMGRYVNDHKTVIIEDTILPKKYKPSRYFFDRSSDGLREELELRYKAEPRLIYVGEWHTHPDGSAEPSGVDLKAMRELANDKNVLITNPVLMILEIKSQAYHMAVYFLYNNELLRYDSELNEN